MQASNRLAAAINLSVGASAWMLGRWTKREDAPMRAPTAKPEASLAPASEPRPVGLLAVAGVCGFLALAFETIWFRALVLVFGATTYSFTIMVAVFLVGIALGSGALGWLANQQRPATWVLAGSLTTVGLWTLMSLRLYDSTPELLLSFLVRLGFTWPALLLAKVALAGLLLLPLAVLSGLCFTALARLVRDRTASPGPALSAVFSVNSLGSATGAVIAGFVMLPMLGLEKSLLVLGIAGLLAGLAVAWRATGAPRPLRLAFTAAALVIAAGLRLGASPWDPLLLSSGAYFNPRTHVSGDQVVLREKLRSLQLLVYQEGKTATVSVTRTPGGRLHYSSQGKVEADTSEAGMSLQRLQGHLPMLLHPNPRRVLNIGLGAGVTAGALTCYPDAQVEVVDIEPAAVQVAAAWAGYNHDLIRRGRFRLRINDGRNHLLVTPTRYDVITSDPFEPVVAGAASLYTVEHFQLARSRLAPGGLVAQFLPLYELSSADVLTIMRSFLKVFPRSAIFFTGVETILVGLDDDAHLDFATVAAKFKLPEVRASLEEIGVDRPERVLEMMLADLTRESMPLMDGPTHTDDLPVIEYSAPRSCLSYFVDLNLQVLLMHCLPVPEVYLSGLKPEEAASVRLAHQGLQTLLQGCIRRSTGDLPGSLELIREAARQAPANPLVRTELARTLTLLADEARGTGRAQEAITLYREILQLNPKDFWGLHHLAMLLREKDSNRADQYLRQALAAYPNEPLLLALRGRWRGMDGDLAGACEDLQAATRQLPLRSDFWSDYAVCLEKAGRKPEAANAANRARAARNW
jgi:spermidine synthase